MKLKELRKNANLTQNEISKIINVAITTYNGYEQENREPNIETLIKLANYYNCTLDYLVGREQENILTKYYAEKKELLKVAEKLNKENLLRLVIYATGLLDGQKTN